MKQTKAKLKRRDSFTEGKGQDGLKVFRGYKSLAENGLGRLYTEGEVQKLIQAYEDEVIVSRVQIHQLKEIIASLRPENSLDWMVKQLSDKPKEDNKYQDEMSFMFDLKNYPGGKMSSNS